MRTRERSPRDTQIPRTRKALAVAQSATYEQRVEHQPAVDHERPQDLVALAVRVHRLDLVGVAAWARTESLKTSTSARSAPSTTPSRPPCWRRPTAAATVRAGRRSGGLDRGETGRAEHHRGIDAEPVLFGEGRTERGGRGGHKRRQYCQKMAIVG